MPIPTPPPAPGHEDVPGGVLRAGLAHTACILLSDAAQHVNRTAMLVEAATAMALQRALLPGGDKDWVLVLEAAERAMAGASDTFAVTSKAAIKLVRDEVQGEEAAPGGG